MKLGVRTFYLTLLLTLSSTVRCSIPTLHLAPRDTQPNSKPSISSLRFYIHQKLYFSNQILYKIELSYYYFLSKIVLIFKYKYIIFHSSSQLHTYNSPNTTKTRFCWIHDDGWGEVNNQNKLCQHR